MVTCNSLKILSLCLNSIIHVKTTVPASIMRCIQVIGGGAFRYALYYDMKFISDLHPQESIKVLQPGAIIVPVIISSDKT